MEDTPKALRRGLFGVRAGDVQQLLADRDATAAAAAEQVRAAEERAKAFEARAASLEAQLSEVTSTPTIPDQDTTDPHELLLAVREEMARVMHATQEAGSRLLEHTRSNVEQQLEDSERRRSEVEADRERLTTWAGQVQESTTGLRQSILEAAGVMQRTVGSLQEAERTMARIVGRMVDTDALLGQPIVVNGAAANDSEPASVPHPVVVGNGNGSAYDAPAPPVEVTGAPAAPPVGEPDTDAIGAEVGHEESGVHDETDEDNGSAGEHGENGERALASSWAAGPAGRRPAENGH
jgi:hypothetical protein